MAATPGAYYETEMDRMEREGRVRNLPWAASLDAITAWDLGIGDSTSIVFAHVRGPEVRLIDYVALSELARNRWSRQKRRLEYAA